MKKPEFIHFAFRCSILVVLFVLSDSKRSHVGRNFILAFMQNREASFEPKGRIYITNVSQKTAAVQISTHRASLGYFVDVILQVEPMETLEHAISIRAHVKYTGEKPNGIAIDSTADIIVSAASVNEKTSDAFLVFPISSLGFDYFVLSYLYTGQSIMPQGPSQFCVVAAEDNTMVTFTFRKDYKHGLSIPSNTFSILLDRLIVYQGDHIVEQMPPANTWGSQYILVPLATRQNGDLFRVLAASDDTRIRIANSFGAYSTVAIDTAEYYDIDGNSTNAIYLQGNKGILVAQLSKSNAADNVDDSDPFMTILTSQEQSLQRFAFSPPKPFNGDYQHYINLAVEKEKLKNLRLDGMVLKPTWMQDIQGHKRTFTAVQLPVTNQQHVISSHHSSATFTAIAYGFKKQEAYGFAPGRGLEVLNYACARSQLYQDDLFDNDCDGVVDEELMNGIDDDLDGEIDEDTSVNASFTFPPSKPSELPTTSMTRLSTTSNQVHTSQAKEETTTNAMTTKTETKDNIASSTMDKFLSSDVTITTTEIPPTADRESTTFGMETADNLVSTDIVSESESTVALTDPTTETTISDFDVRKSTGDTTFAATTLATEPNALEETTSNTPLRNASTTVTDRSTVTLDTEAASTSPVDGTISTAMAEENETITTFESKSPESTENDVTSMAPNSNHNATDNSVITPWTINTTASNAQSDIVTENFTKLATYLSQDPTIDSSSMQTMETTTVYDKTEEIGTTENTVLTTMVSIRNSSDANYATYSALSKNTVGVTTNKMTEEETSTKTVTALNTTAKLFHWIVGPDNRQYPDGYYDNQGLFYPGGYRDASGSWILTNGSYRDNVWYPERYFPHGNSTPIGYIDTDSVQWQNSNGLIHRGVYYPTGYYAANENGRFNPGGYRANSIGQWRKTNGIFDLYGHWYPYGRYSSNGTAFHPESYMNELGKWVVSNGSYIRAIWYPQAVAEIQNVTPSYYFNENGWLLHTNRSLTINAHWCPTWYIDSDNRSTPGGYFNQSGRWIKTKGLWSPNGTWYPSAISHEGVFIPKGYFTVDNFWIETAGTMPGPITIAPIEVTSQTSTEVTHLTPELAEVTTESVRSNIDITTGNRTESTTTFLPNERDLTTSMEAASTLRSANETTRGPHTTKRFTANVRTEITGMITQTETTSKGTTNATEVMETETTATNSKWTPFHYSAANTRSSKPSSTPTTTAAVTSPPTTRLFQWSPAPSRADTNDATSIALTTCLVAACVVIVTGLALYIYWRLKKKKKRRRRVSPRVYLIPDSPVSKSPRLPSASKMKLPPHISKNPLYSKRVRNIFANYYDLTYDIYGYRNALPPLPPRNGGKLKRKNKISPLQIDADSRRIPSAKSAGTDTARTADSGYVGSVR